MTTIYGEYKDNNIRIVLRKAEGVDKLVLHTKGKTARNEDFEKTVIFPEGEISTARYAFREAVSGHVFNNGVFCQVKLGD